MFYVYIITNKLNTVLYIGMTNNLQRRIIEHKLENKIGFSKKYKLTKLVSVEPFKYVDQAISYEKKLKNWRRKWKLDLISDKNPKWRDWYEDLFGDFQEILNQVQDLLNLNWLLNV